MGLPLFNGTQGMAHGNNRPVILDEAENEAAHRNIPVAVCLADCLKETKANSQSEYVVPNRDGEPLSYTQFKRLGSTL